MSTVRLVYDLVVCAAVALAIGVFLGLVVADLVRAHRIRRHDFTHRPYDWEREGDFAPHRSEAHVRIVRRHGARVIPFPRSPEGRLP